MEMWEALKRMREGITAPVDTMGCDRLARSNNQKYRRFQVLVSLMLSSQTKDEVTAAAMDRLLSHYSVDFNANNVADSDSQVLEQLLYPVGFYRRKAEYLQRAAKIIISDHDGDIPDSIEGLCRLPGVGPKMAHLAMAAAWNKVTGIGVDVHVHRISTRIGWVPHTAKDPERARLALESVIPENMWGEVNHLLVGLGQTVCLPKSPKCGECALVRWCRFGQSSVNW